MYVALYNYSKVTCCTNLIATEDYLELARIIEAWLHLTKKAKEYKYSLASTRQLLGNNTLELTIIFHESHFHHQIRPTSTIVYS